MSRQSTKLVRGACVLLALLPASVALAQGGGATPAKPADTKPAPAKSTPPKTAALPTAQEVQDKYIEAMGGKENFNKIKFRVLRGKFDMASMKKRADFEVWQGPDRQFYQVLDIPDVGKVEEGSDGHVVWERGPGGTRLLHDKERANSLRDNDIGLETNLLAQTNFPLSDVASVEKVGDRDAYKLIMISLDGCSAERFYDTQTGLLLRQTRTITAQNTELPTEALFEDYRDTAIGVKQCFLQRQRFLVPALKDKGEAMLTLTAVEYFDTADAEKFKLPFEVRKYIADLKGEELEETRNEIRAGGGKGLPSAPDSPAPAPTPASPKPAPKPAPKP